MAADNESVDREEQWFTWAKSALGADEARGRAAARAAAAVQGTGAGFTAAAAAARAAYADDGASRTDPLPWAANSAPAGIEHGSTRLHSPDGHWIWNGQDWIVADHRRAAVAREPLKPLMPPSKGLSSWVDGATSEDLFYGRSCRSSWLRSSHWPSATFTSTSSFCVAIPPSIGSSMQQAPQTSSS